jgi:hypothetical protein
MKMFILALFLLAQTPQQPPLNLEQTATQLETIAKQLRAAVPVSTATVVTTADELTAALKACKAITLAPGPYVGNFVQTCGSISGPRTAVLTPADPLGRTLDVRLNTGTVANSGITIEGGTGETVGVGTLEATSLAAQPSHVTFDNVSIHPRDALVGGHRGLALHGSDVTVTNSVITGYWEKRRDSQGIWICNGPGPYTITGNTIEASGENILTCGGDPGIVNMVPADIVIRGNTLRKPVEYKALGAQVKNQFELKNARRVLFDGNTLDGWWPPTQWAPIQLTPRNQDGTCPWCTVEDVAITNNVVKNAAGGFAINIQGTDNEKPSAQMKNVTIRGNLFQDTTAGLQILGAVDGSLVIDHNTWPAITWKFISFDDVLGHPRRLTPLTVTNNVFASGEYAVTGNGAQSFGLPSLQAFTTGLVWSGNVIEATANWPWPDGQSTVPKGALAGLLDPGTFKLKSGTAGY